MDMYLVLHMSMHAYAPAYGVSLGPPFCDRVRYSFSSSNDPQLASAHCSQEAGAV